MTDPDYVARNRAAWNEAAAEYAGCGEASWAAEPRWGIFGIPEADASLLPDVDGKDVLEDGCGTGYVSAWLARRGARPVGLDSAPAQLATARRLQNRHGLHFPLINGIAERLPFKDSTFDLVISEYGAVLWSDSYRWIPEAARVLRPGGDLITLSNGVLLTLCVPNEQGIPADNVMKRDYFGMHRIEWPADDVVEFHLGYGDWIRLLRASDFEVIDLVELRPAEGTTMRYDWVTVEWARRWPVEEAWIAKKK